MQTSIVSIFTSIIAFVSSILLFISILFVNLLDTLSCGTINLTSFMEKNRTLSFIFAIVILILFSRIKTIKKPLKAVKKTVKKVGGATKRVTKRTTKKVVNHVSNSHRKHKQKRYEKKYKRKSKKYIPILNDKYKDCKSISNGEKMVMNYLTVNNIDFDYQKKYEGLVGEGNRLLSYDFYLPKYKLEIEVQGQGHAHGINFNGKKTKQELEKQFERQQEHDKRKCNYAKEHDLKLLEIWYWDFNDINIKTILDKELKINGKIPNYIK